MKNFKIYFALLAFTFAFAFTSCKKKISDSDLQKAVTEKINTMADANGMSATVKDGVVTLTGECKDEECKTACQTAIAAIPGVKSVINECTITSTVTNPPVPEQPATIAEDDPLKSGVKDATKDFTGVKAEVSDGVITLTGEISRNDLPRLMMSINTLKPKKIENKLTIK